MKEIKPFTNNMIPWVENPRESMIQLQLRNQINKVMACKININIQLFYASNKQSERENQKTISFTIASKRIKYSGINLTKCKTCTLKTTKLC